MYLKRLELHGFKTFASETSFQFDEGITAIVGPNGVGKSNIADAVRWVLGEQRYTILRGKRTEDVIFAGTGRRPRMGMAEAIVTFDNTSQWLPVEFSEVTVGRRVYRSGENRYMLNGSRVRLRDVVELVGRAGLGRHGLVTIGQGVADAALSLRPDERRVLFEEAAGIRLYQEKRQDALNKLAETRQNLLRLTDILSEIRPRLRDLERQAGRAEEHGLLGRDLEKLLRTWYGYRWQNLQVRLSEAEASLRRRLTDVELARARMHETEALLGDTQAGQADLRRQLSLWHGRSAELHSEAESTGRELAVSRERWSLLQQRLAEFQAELAGLKDRREGFREALSAGRAESQRIGDETHSLQTRLAELRQTWQQTDEARLAAEQAVEAEREQIFQLATALAEARNRRSQLQERRVQVVAQREKAEAELTEAEDQLPALERELAEVRRQSEALQRLEETAAARQQELQEQAGTLEQDWSQRRDELAEADRRLQRLQDRQQMLQGLRQSLTGYAAGTRAVLQAVQRLPGIVGPVSRLLRVPQELERAVEAALGPYAQALILERWEDARKAIEHLRETSAGQATFVPLDSLTTQVVQEPLRAEGVLGLGQQLIEYDARFEQVARLLLGHVVIVQDLDTALRVRGLLRPAQQLVTLAGEVVQASGVVSAGSEHIPTGFLAQEREWRELPGRLSVAQQTRQAAQTALQEVQQRQEAGRRELAETAAEQRRLSEKNNGLQRSHSELLGKQERLKQEVDWRRRLADQQQREVSALDERAAAVQYEAAEREQEHDQRRARLSASFDELSSAREAEEAARGAVADAETALAVAQRQSKAQEHLLSHQQGNLDDLEQEITVKSQRSEETEQESEELEQRVQGLQARADVLSGQIAELAAQIEPAEAEVVAAGRQAQGLERELARARQRLSELEVLYNQHLLAKERRNDELQALEERIEEELGEIEYPSERVRQLRLQFFRRDRQVLAPLESLPDNIQAEIKEVKGRLRRLGSINPDAPREYQEVRERFEFMQSQMADLEHSAASLQEVISELDELMQAEFVSVFSTAATEFTRYFQVLFGGGQARLILTEPDDLAITGVDIVAHPPGKRQQSLALLSGGERALTATALLFAILKARPLPFCVLDEVDAMLDEANVGRFRALLEEFSEQTQFMVITHNRKTIEAANTIYGISMSDDGVSQVVSLRLQGEEVSG